MKIELLPSPNYHNPVEPPKEHYKKKRVADDLFPKLQESSSKRIKATVEEQGEGNNAVQVFQQIHPSGTTPEPAKELPKLKQLLHLLNQANIVTPIIEDVIQQHKDIDLLYSLAELLKSNGLLDENTFLDVAIDERPAGLLTFLGLMSQAGILEEETLDSAFNVEDMLFATRVMSRLLNAGILTENNVYLTITYSGIKHSFLEVLKFLQDSGHLTESTFQAARKQESILSLGFLLFTLTRENIREERIWNIAVHVDSPGKLYEALETLAKVPHLVTERNVSKVFHALNPCEYAKAFVVLYQQGHRPNREVQKLVFEHQRPESSAKAVVILAEGTRLKKCYLETAMRHESPEKFALAAVILSQKNLLTDEYLELVFQHRDPDDLAESFGILQHGNLMTAETISLVSQYHSPKNLANALHRLNSVGILTPENQKAVEEHVSPTNLASAFQHLHTTKKFTPEHRALVISSNFPSALVQVLDILTGSVLLLSEVNCAKLAQFDPNRLLTVQVLYNKGLLNQDIFDWLCVEKGIYISNAINNLSGHRNLNETTLEIVKTHHSPTDFAFACQTLADEGILLQNNQKWITEHPQPAVLARAFVILQKASVPMVHFEWLAGLTEDLLEIAQILVKLQQRDLLTFENRDCVYQSKNRRGLNSSLKELEGTDLLDDKLFQMLACCSDPISHCKALKLLQKIDILTKRNRTHISMSSNPWDLALVILHLHLAKLDSDLNVKLAFFHEQQKLLYKILCDLVNREMLTQKIWAQMLEHPDLKSYESILTNLYWECILFESTRAIAADHPRPDLLAKAVKELNDRRILTLENFRSVVEHADPFDAVCLISEIASE